MPRIQRNQSAAVIEVSIPLQLSRATDDDEDVVCFICAHSYCSEDACARTLTHVKCCSQAVCCGCAVKLARRCKCTDDCEAIIAICPFCREMAALDTLEVFLGGRPPCKACVKDATPNVTPDATPDVTPEQPALEGHVPADALEPHTTPEAQA